MITEGGKAAIRDLINTNYTKMKIGNGGDSTNPNASDLDVPLVSATTSNTTSGDTAIDFKGTFTGSDIAGQTIKEIAIFNTAETIMLGRISIDGFGPLASTDSIDIIITMEVQ